MSGSTAIRLEKREDGGGGAALPSGHVDSWYARTANAVSSRPVLKGEVSCDVAVLGAGYTGLTAALTLARRGYSVIVLEAGRVGWAASGRNGGQIVSGYNQSMADITALVGRDDARKLWLMNEEAKDLIRRRVAEEAIRCDLKWGYVFAALKPRQIAELDETVAEWCGQYGYEGLERLDRDAMRALVGSPRYIGGLLDRGSGHLHPLNYALGLAEASERAGVRIYEGSAVTTLDTGRAPFLATEEGKVKAKHLVIAGNALLGRLVPALDRKIAPVGTYIAATAPMDEARMRSILGQDVAVCDVNFVLNYFRKSPDNRLLFGARVSYSGRDPANLAQRMRASMCRVFPQLADMPFDHVWGGLVDITVNRLPHLGRISPTVYFAQGFSGHGVALTGMAGTVIAEAVAGSAERFDVFARIPHRDFPGGAVRTPLLRLAMLWYRLRDLL